MKKTTLPHCLTLSAILLSCACAASAQTTSKQDPPLLRVYEVNKKVSDFPAAEDLSTPESAYAAINRAIAAGKAEGMNRVYAPTVRVRDSDTVTPEEAEMWLQAEILEVRIFRGNYARITARLGSGDAAIESRGVKLIDGRWLNVGHTMVGTRDRAVAHFYKTASLQCRPPKREPVEHPEAHLKTFVDYLEKNGRDPKEFILDALADRKLVIIGELHHRPAYWALNSAVVADKRFAERAGVVYMELPMHDQGLVDTFLAAERLDTMPVIEMLRNMLWMGWPDQPMLDFFVAIWKANQSLPPAKRIRIVLADMARPYSKIRQRSDWRKYSVNRDSLMAENILKDRKEHSDDARHGLFIVGRGHVLENLTTFVGDEPKRTAGWHLRQELGEQVYSITQHTPIIRNVGPVSGRACLGLFDSAFAALEYKPVAFRLTDSPFGKNHFDSDADAWPWQGRYQDAYDAYIFLTPLEKETFSPLIDGFYTDEFVQELDRRYRMMHGKGLIEAWGLAELDGESFIRWMSSTWGQPREWRGMLGPIDAWKYGDDWEERFRKASRAKALANPDMIRREAQQLFEAIRDADYSSPKKLWRLNYDAYKWFDAWVRWVCREFKANPIVRVELGEVFMDRDVVISGQTNLPTVPYKLTLKDGTVLEGKLPFEFNFDGGEGHWHGMQGIDWHLKYRSGLPKK